MRDRNSTLQQKERTPLLSSDVIWKERAQNIAQLVIETRAELSRAKNKGSLWVLDLGEKDRSWEEDFFVAMSPGVSVRSSELRLAAGFEDK